MFVLRFYALDRRSGNVGPLQRVVLFVMFALYPVVLAAASVSLCQPVIMVNVSVHPLGRPGLRRFLVSCLDGKHATGPGEVR